MEDLNAMITRDACRHLLMRYATAIDAENIDSLVSVFCDDLIWTRPSTKPMRTHAEVRQFFQEVFAVRRLENPQGYVQRHHFTTVSIEPMADDAAVGIAYALVYTDTRFAGTLPVPMCLPELVVEYRDAFRKTQQGWKILTHEAHHIFRSAGAFVGLKDAQR